MAKRSPDAVDIEVGGRIRLQRLSAGMSQTELGQKIGVTFQQVQKYEKGVNRVGAGRLTKIATVLNVPVSTFFGKSTPDEGGGDQALSPVQHLTVPGALRLVQAYGRISDPELRRAIVTFVECLTAEAKVDS